MNGAVSDLLRANAYLQCAAIAARMLPAADELEAAALAINTARTARCLCGECPPLTQYEIDMAVTASSVLCAAAELQSAIAHMRKIKQG